MTTALFMLILLLPGPNGPFQWGIQHASMELCLQAKAQWLADPTPGIQIMGCRPKTVQMKKGWKA